MTIRLALTTGLILLSALTQQGLAADVRPSAADPRIAYEVAQQILAQFERIERQSPRDTAWMPAADGGDLPARSGRI